MNIRRNITRVLQISFYWPFLFLFRVFLNFRVEGTDNLKMAGTSFILAVNHVSYLDPISVFIALPFRLKYIPLFYMASDFFYKLLFFYRFVGAIRARKGSDLELSSRPLIEKLGQGERVVIFPEGGLNTGVSIMRRPRRGISYVAAKSNKFIVPLKIESNLNGAVNALGGPVIDLLTGRHWIKMIFGKPFKIDETIGKIPESLSELRKASAGVFKRIKMA
jgi:acyl-[acyl-carrier-protein]-phospholipid O-acyltransferase/long-chain-fatty-acid--[acyl-carrier-protein] ligase